MAILKFPPLDTADEHGLLAVGGDLDVDSLLLAYRNGIFPWPVAEDILTWFAPPQRAILFFDQLHLSRTFKRKRRQLDYQIRVNTTFTEVVRLCAELVNRGKQKGTWITEEMLAAYPVLHEAGYAHSFECFDGEELVGGVYGVCIGQYFAAESMFYRKPYASMFALCALVEHLEKQGVLWLDCQVLSSFLETLGVIEVPRKEFMVMLKELVDQRQLEF